MNKIYRIIWNSALNAWVVVSELTRNHTKRASSTAAVAVLATLLSATAQASTNASGGANQIMNLIRIPHQVLMISLRLKIITSLVLLLWVIMEI